MATLRISELTAATGFPTATLRYYETVGLLSPARDPNGYRRYDTADVDRLRFVARAKHLGLRLEQIAELLELRGDGRCPPVRTKLATLVSDKLRETRDSVAELSLFADELAALAQRIVGTEPPTKCGEGCGCPDHPFQLAGQPVTVACSLPPQPRLSRAADWRAVVGQADRVEETDRGWRLMLPGRADLVVQTAGLAADERRCCPFLDFTLALRGDGLILEVQAPGEARGMVRDLFGFDLAAAPVADG